MRQIFLLYSFISVAFCANLIQIENANAGATTWELTNPPSWRTDNYVTPEIEGYASATSVNIGESITLFVSTTAPNFTMEVYRMGYYNGTGARRMSVPSIDGQIFPGVYQVHPWYPDASTRLECNWSPSVVLNVPTSWVSGYYVVKLQEGNYGIQSYIIFVVRDDDRIADYVMTASVTTWQAYNTWGGYSLYGYPKVPWGQQAKEVSFDRPYAMPPFANAAAGAGAGDFFTHEFDNGTYLDIGSRTQGWEYQMVRWLEKNGYDVTYATNIDIHRDPRLLLKRKALLSVGHDEYWTKQMRLNVENARDMGVHLGFFSGNAVWGRIRLMSSSQGVANRVIQYYGADYITQDPVYVRYQSGTSTWDDIYPHLNTATFYNPDRLTSVPGATNWREDSLLGGVTPSYATNSLFTVYEADHWIYSGTGVSSGTSLSRVVGYEVGYFKPGSPTAPPGVHMIGHSYTGKTAGDNVYYADMLAYTAKSGSRVVFAGSVQWSWGLDNYVVRTHPPINEVNPTIQTMTSNILSRFSSTNDGEISLYTTSPFTLRASNATRSRWLHTVPGDFSPNSMSDLVAYDPFNQNPSYGIGQFYQLGNSPMLSFMSSDDGWRKTWKFIVPGKFYAGSVYADLFLYDSLANEGWFYTPDGYGGYGGPMVRATGGLWTAGYAQPRVWDIIVAGDLTDSPYSDLLCYDADTHDIFVFRTDGYGNMIQVGSPIHHDGMTWSTIQLGDFSSNPYHDILLYDPKHDPLATENRGCGYFYSMDPNTGAFSLYGTGDCGWRSTWSTIVAGKFSSWTYDDLVLYDYTTGELYFFHTNAGSIIYFDFASTRKSWKSISVVPSPGNGSPYAGLLFYDQNPATPL